MKIAIGYALFTEYTVLKDINFEAETDVTGGETPIGQLVVTVKTTDDIEVAQFIKLLGDDNTCWCKYWITDVNRLNADYVKIEAQSMLLILDRIKLEPAMYDSGVDADVAISAVFQKVTTKYGTQFYIDPTFVQSAYHRVYGFCPEQTARQRLQQICFSIGAYIKTFFTDVIQILPVPSTATLIPVDKTFWHPELEYDDIVTELKVFAYSFTAGTPSTTDEYVTDKYGDTYIVSKQEFTLSNPNVPVRCLENVAEVDIQCITSDNVTDILTLLSAYYFSRVRVKADVLNAGEYLPGNKYTIYNGLTFATGYMRSADFIFGHGSKTKVDIGSSEEVEAASLLIYDVDQQDEDIDTRTFTLPVGYAYSIQNKFIDIAKGKHRYIYYPENEYVTGTMPSGGDTKIEYFDVALDHFKKTLHIIRVDGCDIDESGVVSIE